MDRSQFVLLEYAAPGHHAVCDSPDCGSRTPEYRLLIGNYTRYLCERCLIGVSLSATRSGDLRPTVPEDLVDPGRLDAAG